MLVVLNPLSETDDVFLQDVDMAGPLACVSAFAGLLLLVNMGLILNKCYVISYQ